MIKNDLKIQNEKKELRLQILEEEYAYDVNNDEEIEGKLNSNNENEMDQWFKSEYFLQPMSQRV